jgi:uncharacterized membrane protein
MVMTRQQLLKSIDSERVKTAIERAEDQTSGEIVVSVAPFFWGSVEKAARRAFARLGITQTICTMAFYFSSCLHEERLLFSEIKGFMKR